MNRISKFGIAVASVLVLMAALSPLLASWERVQSQNLVSRLDSPDRAHPMGRDQLGRDELGRIIRSVLGLRRRLDRSNRVGFSV